jgi:choline kinase
MARIRDAVILAAGVGKRLRPFTETRPKSLIVIGGLSLMERHLGLLAAEGVERAVIVIGHCGEQIREQCGAACGDLEILYEENPDYERGSILSLRAGLDALGDPVSGAIWMDADVLYHPRVLGSLLTAEAPLTLLLDPTYDNTGEEMVLGVRNARVLRIERGLRGDYDLTGESVGFFAVSGGLLPDFRRHLAGFAASGRLDAEYEEAVDEFLPSIEAGYIDIGRLPWIEIDFPQDLEEAERIFEALRAEGFE